MELTFILGTGLTTSSCLLQSDIHSGSASAYGSLPKTFITVTFRTTLQSLELQDKYCVIIDAGSSGSRVHVYQYFTFTGEKLPIVRQRGKVLRTKVALSSFSGHASDSGASLAPLITYAQEQVESLVLCLAPGLRLSVLVSLAKSIHKIFLRLQMDCSHWRHMTFCVAMSSRNLGLCRSITVVVSIRSLTEESPGTGQLLDEVNVLQVPDPDRRDTSIHLMATAGMRLLLPADIEATLESCRQAGYFLHSTCLGCLNSHTDIIQHSNPKP